MKKIEHLLFVVAFFCISSPAGAAVSLLQDIHAIECGLKPTAQAGFDRLRIDAKDNHLELLRGSKKVVGFEQLKFLDSAVLMKREGKAGPDAHGGQKEVVLFLLQSDGEPLLLRGGLFPFEEKNCDDTGASKTCKTALIERLVWSPEKLDFKAKKNALQADVSRYGVFTGRGTYFLAEADGVDKRRMAVAILDYGSKVDLVFGRIFKLDCH